MNGYLLLLASSGSPYVSYLLVSYLGGGGTCINLHGHTSSSYRDLEQAKYPALGT